MKIAAHDNMAVCLRMLAEIYHAARRYTCTAKPQAQHTSTAEQQHSTTLTTPSSLLPPPSPSLWPLSKADAGKGVTIHIGKLRGLKLIEDIASGPYLQGNAWLLVKTGDADAVVTSESVYEAHEILKNKQARFLQFWASRWEDKGREKSESEKGRV